MGTTIIPTPAFGPDDQGYHSDLNFRPERSLSNTQLRRLMESKKSPKQIIKEAQGVLSVGKKKKPKTYKAGKNLATEAKGKRGLFGQKVATPLKGKGVRVAESEQHFEEGLQRFREAGVKGMKWGTKHAKSVGATLQKAGFKHNRSWNDEAGDLIHSFKHPDGRSAFVHANGGPGDYEVVDKRGNPVEIQS